jgi:outer membrane protein OmpA-like peptidoglycan-associated protein
VRYGFVLLVMALVAAPAVLAGPALDGGRGLFRLQNALAPESPGLTLSLQSHNRMRDYPFPADPEGQWGRLADFIGTFSITPVATDYVDVELLGSCDGLIMLRVPGLPEGTLSGSRLETGARSAVAGGKLSTRILPVFKPGLSIQYVFNANPAWPDPDALPVAARHGLQWRGLATFQFQDLVPFAPNLILNYGRSGQVYTYGAGLGWDTNVFALYVEAVSQQPAAFTNPFVAGDGRLLLTPGITIGGPTGVALKLGYTFAAGRDAVSELFVGLCAGLAIGRRLHLTPRPAAGAAATADTGLAEHAALPTDSTSTESLETDVAPAVCSPMAGVVTDASTGKPLAARIEFPNTALAPTTTDTTSGMFQVTEVPVGVCVVTATADGHVPATQVVAVDSGRTATANFSLNPNAALVPLIGKTSDKKTGAPVAARISFPGTGIAGVVADSNTGSYQVRLPAGAYAIQVEADSYIKQTAAIVIEQDKPLARDFELVKEGMVISLRGVLFDPASANVKPESRPALDDAAKILRDNPTIKVEIQGHTDNEGEKEYNLELSASRAAAVVSDLVRNYGIDIGRLTAKGYGESNPVADNATAEGRALNRRVEFVILSTGQ